MNTHKSLLILIAFTLFSIKSFAQLHFKNSTNKPIRVVYAMWNDSKYQDHWYTKGWYTIDPGQTAIISNKVGLSSYVYYYAESIDNSKTYSGDTRLLVERGNHGKPGFYIKNADKKYKKESSENYHWAKFRRFNYKKGLLGITKVKQYINLKY